LQSRADSGVDLTIFVPCYNEAEAIKLVLSELAECLPPSGITYEILVIDDHSADGSPAAIGEFMRQRPEVDVRLVVNESNRGISHNYSNAAFLARGEFFCRMGGHFQDRRDAILPLVERMGEADLVIGYLADDRRTTFRRTLSKAFTRLVNLLSGYDVRYYLGVAIFRTALVQRWHSYRDQAFQADMIVQMLDQGCSHLQVPIRAHRRPAGRSRAISLVNFLSVTFCLADILGRRILKRRAPRARA
jgi:glycosyltransferase involved in cell wall biosynthesis